MNQSEFSRAAAGESQADRILARLIRADGQEVTMPELAHVGADDNEGFCMVHSRVADLRKRGHHILSRCEKRDGKMHSFYRLVPKPSQLN